jgi:hypothetical protein
MPCKKGQVVYRTPSGKRACRKKRSARSYIRKSKRKSTGKKRKSSSKKRKSSSKKRKSPSKKSGKRKSSKKSSKKKRKTRKDKGMARKPPAYPWHLDQEDSADQKWEEIQKRARMARKLRNSA